MAAHCIGWECPFEVIAVDVPFPMDTEPQIPYTGGLVSYRVYPLNLFNLITGRYKY